MHKHPAQLRRAGEQASDELVFLVDVAVQQLGQGALVDVGAHAHHGEFEETGHGRREDVQAPPLVHAVQQERALGEALEQLLGGALRQLPGTGCLARGERPQRELRQQVRVLLVEEQREDPQHQLGRRHARWEPVHPVNELVVARWGEMMGHRLLGRGLS